MGWCYQVDVVAANLLIEAQPKDDLYTRYEPSEPGQPVILRHVITAAHVRFALRFQLKIEQLHIENGFKLTDSNKDPLTLALASCVFYKEVTKTKEIDGVDIPYKVVEKIISDPLMYYTLPPKKADEVIVKFYNFIMAHGFIEAMEKYNQMQAMLESALPTKPVNGEGKKKSPSKK